VHYISYCRLIFTKYENNGNVNKLQNYTYIIIITKQYPIINHQAEALYFKFYLRTNYFKTKRSPTQVNLFIDIGEYFVWHLYARARVCVCVCVCVWFIQRDEWRDRQNRPTTLNAVLNDASRAMDARRSSASPHQLRQLHVASAYRVLFYVVVTSLQLTAVSVLSAPPPVLGKCPNNAKAAGLYNYDVSAIRRPFDCLRVGRNVQWS